MKIKLYKTFGEIEIETSDDKEAIAQSSFWSELPETCPLCNASLYLHFRVTKEGDYKYYELHCRGQKPHFTQFGQYKSGGLFYKKDSWAEHTFGVQSERDSEINDFDDDTAQRIKNAIEHIKKLGGKVESARPGESQKEYLDSLIGQYNRLKNK